MANPKNNTKEPSPASLIENNIDFKLYGLLADTSDACIRARRDELNQYGISPIEARTLFVIQRLRVPSTPAEISKHVYRGHNTVSALLTRMGKKGLIIRTRDYNRKNLWRISLTEKGSSAIDNAAKLESIHKIFTKMSKDERAVMESCLERIQLKALHQIAWNSALSSPWLAKFIMSEK